MTTSRLAVSIWRSRFITALRAARVVTHLTSSRIWKTLIEDGVDVKFIYFLRIILFLLLTIFLLIACSEQISIRELEKREVLREINYFNNSLGRERSILVGGSRSINTKLAKDVTLTRSYYIKNQRNIFFGPLTEMDKLNLSREKSFTRYDFVFSNKKNDFLAATCSTPIIFNDPVTKDRERCVISSISNGVYLSFMYSSQEIQFQDLRDFAIYIRQRYLELIG